MACFAITALLLLAMASHSSATWCVCKEGVDEKTLQRTLDYACGAGADCGPTHDKGSCFNPDTVKDHCSYAVNSYFQKQRQAATACDFSGTATVVTSDPSTGGCNYPASASSTTPTTPNSGTPTGSTPVSGTPTTSTPGSNTPTTTVPGGSSPLVTTTPSNGVLGGYNNNGLAPSGDNADLSFGAILTPKSIIVGSSMILTFCKLVLRLA